MIIDYQLNKASAAFNEIYFDSPQVEILCGSTFGSLCCIKHKKFEFDLFFTFFPNSYFGGCDRECMVRMAEWVRKRLKAPITATSYSVASLQVATNCLSQECLVGQGSLGMSCA